MFADDTSISYAANSMDELQSVVNSELENLHKWLNTNKLSLNIAKTEFMIIGSRQRMSAMDDRITVEINDCEVEKVDSVKSLGIYIDKHLNWSTHIEKISKKIASAIGALKRIRPYVTACTKTRNNRNETTGTTGTKPPEPPERPEQESEMTGTTETKI